MATPTRHRGDQRREARLGRHEYGRRSLASQIVTASKARREVVLISDYQKIAWANHNEAVPAGHRHDGGLGGGTVADVAVSW